MITTLTKFKRGTEWLLNGNSVWIELDQQTDNVFICYQKTRDVTKGDLFQWVVREDLKPINKGRSTITSKPKVLTNKEKTETEKLNDFYKKIALKAPYKCENCGQKLQAFNNFGLRSCTAHILPKAHFPSIATNEDNILFIGAGFLGGCHCHDTFDSDANTRSKMKAFPIALERFEKLKQYLTNKEIIKAQTYLSIQHGNI